MRSYPYPTDFARTGRFELRALCGDRMGSRLPVQEVSICQIGMKGLDLVPSLRRIGETFLYPADILLYIHGHELATK
jgi:hypothetical protein